MNQEMYCRWATTAHSLTQQLFHNAYSGHQIIITAHTTLLVMQKNPPPSACFSRPMRFMISKPRCGAVVEYSLQCKIKQSVHLLGVQKLYPYCFSLIGKWLRKAFRPQYTCYTKYIQHTEIQKRTLTQDDISEWISDGAYFFKLTLTDVPKIPMQK